MTYLVNRLQKVMEVTPRDSSWAYDVNRETSRLHVNVWACKPEPRIVVETIIPLLEKAHGIVNEVPHEGEFGNHVEHYAHSIAIRMISMYRYIRGETAYLPYESESFKPEAVPANSLETKV